MWVSGLALLILAIPTGSLWWLRSSLWRAHEGVITNGVDVLRCLPAFESSTVLLVALGVPFLAIGIKAGRNRT